MNQNLSYLSFLLALTVFFTSCKKDADPESFFSFEGKKYTVVHAVSSGYEGVRIATFSTSEDMHPDFGTIHYISIRFKLPSLQPGTYTFKPSASPDFDPSTNFFGASASLNCEFFYSELREQNVTSLTDVTGGTVTVSRDGQNYTFEYDLDFNGRQLNGVYVGTIK